MSMTAPCSFSRLTFRAKYSDFQLAPTLTGNVFKSANVNLKCTLINHDINYLSRKLNYKQRFAIVRSFTVSVNKLPATDSSISPD